MKRNTVKKVTAALLIAALFSCAKKENVKTESISDIQRREGVPVTVITADKGEIRSYETAGGSVEGLKQATLVCNTPGIIESLYVSVNENVKSGQPLLRINPDIPSMLEISKAQYENAQKSLERMEALYKEGGVSQELLDQVRSGHVAAQASYFSAKKSELLSAPFDGVVTQIHKPLYRNVDRGNPLVDIADIGQVRVKLVVNETAVLRYKKGQQTFAVAGNDTIRGKITEVSTAGSTGNRAFSIDAEFPNSALRLRPGMFTIVRTVVENKPNVVTLPMEAVIKDGRQEYVYVVDGMMAKKVSVKTGIRGGNSYEIREGLKGGESVVMSGASLLSEGVKVRIVK